MDPLHQCCHADRARKGRRGWYTGDVGKKCVLRRAGGKPCESQGPAVSVKQWAPVVRDKPGYPLQSEKLLLHLASFFRKKRVHYLLDFLGSLRHIPHGNAAVVQTPGNTQGCRLCGAHSRKRLCSRYHQTVVQEP